MQVTYAITNYVSLAKILSLNHVLQMSVDASTAVQVFVNAKQPSVFGSVTESICRAATLLANSFVIVTSIVLVIAFISFYLMFVFLFFSTTQSSTTG